MQAIQTHSISVAGLIQFSTHNVFTPGQHTATQLKTQPVPRLTFKPFWLHTHFILFVLCLPLA
jgi:hypothetical protein